MKSRLSLLGLLLWLLMPTAAWSQASVYMCVELTSGIDRCQHVSVANPLPVTGSFSISGFHEELVQAPITATTGGVSSAAFTAGKNVVVTNVGTTNIAYCQLGAAATTSGQPIAPNGGWFEFTSTSETLITCATSTSTTTVNFAVGTGIATGTGGGGGSSGGGAITAADGAIVTIGAVADSAWVSGNGTLVALLKNIAAGVAGSIPNGTNVIGDIRNITGTFTTIPTFKVDQTTPGTTNLVALTPAQTGAGATAGAVPANASYNGVNVAGNLVGLVGDPCSVTAATILPFTIPTNTTTNILAGTAAQKIYVCYLYMQTGLANNVALIEGTTGGTCGSGTAALVGGVTAATGLLNAANSGQAFGNGGFTVLQTQTNNNDICAITSASGPLSGVLKYVKR